MSRFRELKCTTNRYVFNRLYKEWLEDKGKIRCTYCAYHRSENDTRRWYGSCAGHSVIRESKIRNPNWKLVSKNRKQWMNKPLKKEIHNRWLHKYDQERKGHFYEEWYSYKW